MTGTVMFFYFRKSLIQVVIFKTINMKKNYIKCLAVSLTAFCLPAMVSAQFIDVGVSELSAPLDNVTILPGFEQQPVAGTITNFGSTPAEASNLGLGFSLNGVESRTVNLQGPTIAPGNSVNFQPIAFDMSGAIQSGSNRLCVYTFARNSATDTIPGNDSTCINVNYNPNATMDLAVEDVNLVTSPPADPDGRYQVGTLISEIQVTIKNESSVAIPAGSVLPYSFSLDLTSQNMTGTLQADLAPGATTVRNITNPQLLPTMPGVAGTYQLCANTRLSSDNNPANDEFCRDIVVWSPTSVEELEAKDDITTFYNNDRILVDFIAVESQKVDVMVHSMTGQLITQRTAGVVANIQERIELPFNYASGIYVVSIVSNGQILQTDKVMVR